MSEKTQTAEAKREPERESVEFKNECDKIVILSYNDPKNRNATIKLRCIPTKTMSIPMDVLNMIRRNPLSRSMLEQLTEVK